jgi:hypothetical protein
MKPDGSREQPSVSFIHRFVIASRFGRCSKTMMMLITIKKKMIIVLIFLQFRNIYWQHFIFKVS